MKTKFLLSLFILTIMSYCCKRGKTNNLLQPVDFPIKIDLIEGMANPKNIKLSEIADSIAYIPLKNIDEKPIGAILDIKYFPKNIFILVGGSEGGFYRFDCKGNFLNEISSLGRGPAEYTPGSKFSVLDNPEKVYILNNLGPHNLLEFDYDGNFLAKILTAAPSESYFEAVSSERFLFLASHDTSNSLACLKDKNNNTLSSVDHPIFSNPSLKNLNLRYRGTQSGLYYDGLPLFYDESSMDTVYSVSKDTIYAKYIIYKGSEGAPIEKIYSRVNPPESYNYLCPIASSFKETHSDVFIMAVFKNKDLYLIDYNKKSRSVTSMKTPYIVPNLEQIKQQATVYPKIENDIDCGLSLAPGKPDRDCSVWTYTFDAINFKNRLTEEHFQNSKALFPEKKHALQQFVKSVNEFDNPVIMVVYLKRH